MAMFASNPSCVGSKPALNVSVLGSGRPFVFRCGTAGGHLEAAAAGARPEPRPMLRPGLSRTDAATTAGFA